jgi:hypothetical protein
MTEYERQLLEEEQEWLTSDDPWKLYTCTFGRASCRRYRLLCVASCGCLGAVLDGTYWQLLDRLEQAADMARAEDEQQQLRKDAWDYYERVLEATDGAVPRFAADAAYETASGAYDDAFDCLVGDTEEFLRIRPALCDILREIFGNPFRPLTFNAEWRTSDVLLLARGIYEERAFDRMPILADALQDAGCDNDDILSHLRDANATHVRGCWALDLVLEKT